MTDIAACESLEWSQRQGIERPGVITRHQTTLKSHPVPDIPIPLDCRAMILRGALVAVNHSGGKDSQCMMIRLAQLVPHEQLLVVHAPLGEVEWPGTIEHIENTIPPGVPLIMAPVTSGKTLLEQVEERGMWPAKSARWCTSGAKRGPIERELRRYLKAPPCFEGRLVNALGLRRDESRDRARRIPWRRNERMSVAGREVFDWLPVFQPTVNTIATPRPTRIPAPFDALRRHLSLPVRTWRNRPGFDQHGVDPQLAVRIRPARRRHLLSMPDG